MGHYKSLKSVVSNIEKREWTKNEYAIQSWGSWLHRIAPYVGRIKPSFAHFIIKYISNEEDIILDPFCGIGTIPTEAALMNRDGIGNDLNPYAYYIALSKTDNKKSLEELISYLNSIELNTKKISLENIPDWVKEYYNQQTLKEILFLVDKFKYETQYFLLGCLTGISQGHRPGHLSKPCAWTLPYKPKSDDKGEYRETIPRLIAKVKRTYNENFSIKGKLEVMMQDARKLPLKDKSVDHIITSPPYYDTLDYINSHRLRLAILGYYDEKIKDSLRKELIQKFDTYLVEMEKSLREFHRVLKDKSYCVFIVGDCFRNKTIINTANDLLSIAKKVGFTCYAVIEDAIPINKSVQKRTKTQKYDRIIIMTKN